MNFRSIAMAAAICLSSAALAADNTVEKEKEAEELREAFLFNLGPLAAGIQAASEFCQLHYSVLYQQAVPQLRDFRGTNQIMIDRIENRADYATHLIAAKEELENSSERDHEATCRMLPKNANFVAAAFTFYRTTFPGK